ncbi:hyaluronate lyase [Verrucosispora sp. ts21]|uniref:geranylgeranyl reductase family protein n=1 Tax=Verrucosispora sp. ts21 TaxID=2069341 RepID=UPI000C88A56D|nr:geranylgeranyl reductase family protein [Verrucosispora sp. ts21]PMR58097.1 hyaluronate lyase [Verrucosispora sp. ts21]
MTVWELAVIGGGPAGLSAAFAAARRGVRTLVLERATHPRYKTCGGGLTGISFAAAANRIDVPVHDAVDEVTFTLDGRRSFTRRHRSGALVRMVRRDEFDDRLRAAAVAAGAEVRERVTVRAVDQTPDGVRLRLADGATVLARTVVGADGSSGVSARHVGVRYRQVDLGLELELPVSPQQQARWRRRMLLDWGPLPGSYAWVFPKSDRLSVGVIAGRGDGERTRDYLRRFVDRLGLAGVSPVHDTGHLTRCRAEDSPLRRGRVLVAGDAAGLLEPWSREGISFALRSGELAGAAVADADLAGYEHAVQQRLVPAIRAGHRLREVFAQRPEFFHLTLGTPPGWRAFTRFCLGRSDFGQLVEALPVRTALALAARLPHPR